MEPEIIYQDEYLLIIDKPAGWIVNRAGTVKDQPVVQDWLQENFNYDIAKSEEFRSGIVHRIDKETSGILVIAKTEEVFGLMQKLFKDRKVKKTYIALVHGRVGEKEGKIEVPVGRLPWRRDRFGVLPGGRESVTEYSVKSYYSREKEEFSLIEARPLTGRTHQIRIHFKYAGHPLVSDEFYAGRKTARNDRKWCPRLFLHAYRIAFPHPKENILVNIQEELSVDLENALKNLQDKK